MGQGSGSVAVKSDVREWSERVAENFAAARISQAGSAFHGTMSTCDIDGIQLSRVEVSSHIVERTFRQIGASELPRYVLCLQLSGGSSLVAQDGREALLTAGDVAIYDTSRPYTLIHEDDVRCLGAVISGGRVNLPAHLIGSLTATTMSGLDAITAASALAIDRFQQGADELRAPTRHRVGRTIFSLFEALCVNWAEQTTSLKLDRKAELRDSVLAYIAEHLSEPDLDPQRIANAHFISLRSLQALAQQSGGTVAGWIRWLRLERCKEDLSNVRLLDLNVADIGARWGIVHPPHLTTLFSSRYGLTPSAYRKSVC